MVDLKLTISELHRTIQGLTPTWTTVPMGQEIQPNQLNGPWQRGTFIPGYADPIAVGNGVVSRQRCTYQVDCFYPTSLPGKEGHLDELYDRCILVRDTFFPYRKAHVIGDGVVDKLPSIGQHRKDSVSFFTMPVFVSLYLEDAV